MTMWLLFSKLFRKIQNNKLKVFLSLHLIEMRFVFFEYYTLAFSLKLAGNGGGIFESSSFHESGEDFFRSLYFFSQFSPSHPPSINPEKECIFSFASDL